MNSRICSSYSGAKSVICIFLLLAPEWLEQILEFVSVTEMRFERGQEAGK